jgi:hypothetical protein
MSNESKLDKLSDRLNREMMESYSFTSLDRNPVLRLSQRAPALESLLTVLNDYAALPRVIIRLLEKARKKAEETKMTEVAEELELNLTEERGKDPRAKPYGVPHYEMLVRGLEKEFGFRPKSEVRAATEQFLTDLDQVMGSESPGKVIGAVYALESSATPELKVVKQLFEAIANKRGRPLAPKEDLSLIWFIDIHTDTYEVDHESRLKNAIVICLREAQFPDFEQGFREVMNLMETWWKSMAEPIQL